MNAFFIVPVRVKSVLQTLFSTHPPMEKRIERLQQLERSSCRAPLALALSGLPRRGPRADGGS